MGGDALQQETADVLSRLIRFNTVNPPGDERACQEWLAGYLREAGLEVELMGAEPERPNLVATLEGDEPGPVLGYLSHVDTVLADPDDWTHDPWSGDVARRLPVGPRRARHEVADRRGGGRGGHARAQRVAAGARRAEGDLGRRRGGRRLPRRAMAHRAAAGRGRACDWLLNEGAGTVMPYGDRRLYGVCCAEKGTFRFTRPRPRRRRARIGAGAGDNALLKLAPVIARLGERQPEFDVVAEARALLEALGEDAADPAAALERVRAVEPRLATMVEPTLRRHRRADAHLRLREDQRHPRPRRAAGRLPRAARHGRRGHDAARARARWATPTASRSRSWRR